MFKSFFLKIGSNVFDKILDINVEPKQEDFIAISTKVNGSYLSVKKCDWAIAVVGGGGGWKIWFRLNLLK